jgi:hypothetical protein
VLAETKTLETKRNELLAVAKYFEQIANAEHEAYDRYIDPSLSKFERLVAERDCGILNIAGGFVQNLYNHRRFDKRMIALINA